MKRAIVIVLCLLVVVSRAGESNSLAFINHTNSSTSTKIIGYTVKYGQVYKVKERTVKHRYLSQ